MVLGVPPNVGFNSQLLVFHEQFINNKHQGCLKVVVYLFKGAVKYLLVSKAAVKQKLLGSTASKSKKLTCRTGSGS